MASISESVSGKFHGLITPTSAYGTSCERNVIDGCAWERPSILPHQLRRLGAPAVDCRDGAAELGLASR